MKGCNLNKFLLVFIGLLIVSVKGKVIECNRSLLLNAKITDITENKIKAESTSVKEFLEKFKSKSSSNFTLKIANEYIREVCEHSFEHVSGINVLNLASNGINTLKPGCFSGITSLQVLDLSDNELQEIKNGVFNDFQHLQKLVLSNNAIAEIGNRAFGNLPALRYIRLDHNNIIILGHDWFLHSPKLRYLNLSHNRIAAIGPRIFETIRPTCYSEIDEPDNKDAISISTSNSNDLNKDCPSGQRIDTTASAMKINLSSNDIISVHPDALKGLINIDFMDLSDNKLISLKWKDISDGKMIGTIDLRNNLPNLRLQDFPIDKVLIETTEE